MTNAENRLEAIGKMLITNWRQFNAENKLETQMLGQTGDKCWDRLEINAWTKSGDKF